MRLNHLAAFLLCVLGVLGATSCIQEPSDAGKWLCSVYGGSFTKTGNVSLPARLSEKYRSNAVFTGFYSDLLEKDIIVSDMNSNPPQINYISNYLYIKHAESLSSYAASFVKKDFSKVRVLHDYEWLFTGIWESGDTLEHLENEIKWETMYVLIRLEQEEKNDLETRLHSLAYRLTKENFRGTTYIFLTDEAEFSLDSVTFDALETDTELREYFSGKYVISNFFDWCKLEECD